MKCGEKSIKSDIKGLSKCAKGKEVYEGFFIGPSFYLQYDYRSEETGYLFTGIFRSIEEAKSKKDAWLGKLGVAK